MSKSDNKQILYLGHVRIMRQYRVQKSFGWNLRGMRQKDGSVVYGLGHALVRVTRGKSKDGRSLVPHRQAVGQPIFSRSR